MPELSLRVYLSSTKADLLEERDAAMAVITELALGVHSYDADADPAVEKCVADVRSCDLYVGILGHRYGSILGGGAWPTAKSITEMEYEACRHPDLAPIPRLMFLRQNSPDEFRDGAGDHLGADESARAMAPIRALRKRAADEQTPVLFSSLATLREKLQLALARRLEEFRQSLVPGHAHLEIGRRLRPLVPVSLLALAGGDQDAQRRLAGGDAAMIETRELDLARPELALQLDKASRGAQVAVLLLGRSGLGQLETTGRAPALDAVFDLQHRRQGFKACVGLDLTAGDLPAAWRDGLLVETTQAELQTDAAAVARRLLTVLRQRTPLAAGTQVAVPMLVLAPTLAEWQALEQDLDGALESIGDARTRHQRKVQINQAIRSAKALHPGWPATVYGQRRADWRCFGAAAPPLARLLHQVIGRINQAGPGSRERELLQLSELVLRPYDLDELLHDAEGSAAAVRQACEAGALVLVDEAALLHPALREAARVVLACRRSAVATVVGIDPLRWKTQRMLDELSALGNGALVDRFRFEMDLQCELALNSPERLERWLRVAIPRLVWERDGLTPDPRLNARMDADLRSDA